MNGAGMMSMSSTGSASFFSMDGSGGAMQGGGAIPVTSRKRPHDASDLVQIARKIMRLDKEALDARLMQVFVRQSDLNIFELTTLKRRGSSLTQFLVNHSLREPDEVIAAIQAEVPQHREKVVVPAATPISTATVPKSHLSTSGLQAASLQPEIKLAGAGGIPVAISTTLPPAVARLSQQQGGTPLDPARTPDKLGSPHIKAGSGGRVGPGGRLDPADQIAEKAKQEAYVLQRVAGLQREGLWFEKRLPKVAEPSRNKAHWDYLLEEMTWIATDFAQERKWKKAMARKVARSIQKHFQEKKQEKLKAEKAAEMHARKLASFMARGVKQFWNNVGKLVEFKQTTLLEEKRKQALDQHLSFIVGETEKFSSLVAESMNKPATAGTSNSTPPPSTSLSDGEFQPEGDWSDDEETIEREEEHVKPTDQQREIEMLQKESELSLDDILDQLPAGYLEQRAKQIENEEGGSRLEEEDSSDFSAQGSSDDDEATLEEQEAAEARDVTTLAAAAEVQELEADNELSIEQLKAKYGAGVPGGLSGSGGLDTPPQDEADVEMESQDEDEDNEEEDDNLTGSEDESLLDSLASHDDTNLSSLLDPPTGVNTGEAKHDGEADQKMNDVAALAESIQPKGYTLESTSVVTPVPFLLQFPLREYQHVGLDWLVTMYERGLNGILADEMGLGKTIQTISLLAHLACEKGIWGPHLIVVPTSVLLNWEMELKKWAPGFKVLTYYGSIKERRAKRQGWTKPNSFHVCVTSYKLAVQDHQSFRRKPWCYLILDEAQNIKNFKSQRWQVLLNFNTERRLLLTGTPLQNNLNELWSLMHFLMPALFQSHSEFQAWFSHPMKDMIEGNSDYNETIVKRLHKVLRPFLLRRLKSQVEKQLPKKYEHVVMCRLSNRQKYLYDDFMSRTKTKETLANGTMLSVINILMQLRKVCNHPNLFEERATLSPFHMSTLLYQIPSLVFNALNYDVFNHVNFESMNLNLLYNELTLSLSQGFSMRRMRPSPNAIEELATAVEVAQPPPLPRGKPKLRVRCKDPKASVRVVIVNTSATNNNNKVVKTHAINIGNILVRQIICQGGIQGLNAKPALQTSTPGATLTTSGAQVQGIPVQLVQRDGSRSTIKFLASAPRVIVQKSPSGQVTSLIKLPAVISQASSTNTTSASIGSAQSSPVQLISTLMGNKLATSGATSGFVTQGAMGQTITTPSGAVLRVTGPGGNLVTLANRTPTLASTTTGSSGSPLPSAIVTVASISHNSGNVSAAAIPRRRKTDTQASSGSNLVTVDSGCTSPTSMFIKSSLEEKRRERRVTQLALVSRVNNHRLTTPHILYGEELRDLLRVRRTLPQLEDLVCPGYEARIQGLSDVFNNFLLYVPNVTAPPPCLRIHHPHPSSLQQLCRLDYSLAQQLRPKLRLLHPVTSAMSTQFPDPRLIQYDCGKLQSLDVILRKLKTGGHRVLIFTQMTRMLDVLEAFLNFHGHIYLRLDGTTKVDQRQVLMERFNMDPRIFCFILSTRSGGVGVNLTGADTVVFYDSDWNPTMDAQAQDRCHRIGQTRDVHIYRLISEKTIEENILRKANQKRLLGDLAIEGGNFTTAFFKSSTIHDLFSTEQTGAGVSADEREDATEANPPMDKTSLVSLENALAAAEDATDVAAARTARAEAQADMAEFDESIPINSLGDSSQTESKAEQEVVALMEQLSGVERWAVTFFESKMATSGEALATAAAAAEASLQAQKREWELERVAAARRDEERRAQERREARCELLTYASEDAANQVGRKSCRGSERLKGARTSDGLKGYRGSDALKSSIRGVGKDRETRLRDREERLKTRAARRERLNGRLKRRGVKTEEENVEDDDDSLKSEGLERLSLKEGTLSKLSKEEKRKRNLRERRARLRVERNLRRNGDEDEEVVEDSEKDEEDGRRSRRLRRQESTRAEVNGDEELEWRLGEEDEEAVESESSEELGERLRRRRERTNRLESKGESLGSKKRKSDRLRGTNGGDTSGLSLTERINARHKRLAERKARKAARNGLPENCTAKRTGHFSEKNATTRSSDKSVRSSLSRRATSPPPVRKYAVRKCRQTKAEDDESEGESGSEMEADDDRETRRERRERGNVSVIDVEEDDRTVEKKYEIRIVSKADKSRDNKSDRQDENELSPRSKSRVRLVRHYSLGNTNPVVNLGSGIEGLGSKLNRGLVSRKLEMTNRRVEVVDLEESDESEAPLCERLRVGR